MSEVKEVINAESIQEYCYQLGLQVRDSENKNNTEVTLDEQPDDEESRRSPTFPPIEDVSKTNNDCKNCGKCFSSSRQYSKHKCSTVEKPESLPKPKSKRKAKQRRGDRNLAVKAENKGMEPTAQVHEDKSQTIDPANDHTYNKGGKNNEYSGVEDTRSDSVAGNSTVQCELCRLFPDSVSAVKSTGNKQCEKCQELSLSLNKEHVTLSEVEDKAVTDTMTDKKRKYTFKNPETFCSHCNKGFHSGKRLAKHEKVCGKDLICEFCGEDFNSAGQHAYSKYEEHYYTHVDKKPFQCNICSKGFVRKPDLDKHNVIHTAEYESQVCLQCGAVFASAKLLNKHMKKHGRPTWQCEKCKKEFVRQVIYDKHVLTCQVKVSCEVCGKIFTCLSKNVKYRYQEHMFIHTGEKPYKCQFCERAFRDRSTRKKHERTHTGEKPYSCTLCERAFSQLRLLRNHVRTHTGEKPFACELCDLRFAKQCNLKYHIRVHTKEKPYSCQLCQKSFTQSGTYHKHMRRHKGREPDGNQSEVTKTELVQGDPSTTMVEAEVPRPPEPEVQSEPDASIPNNQEGSVLVSEPQIAIIPAENSETVQVVQEIPMASDEIMIVVNEGNATGNTLATIDVEQISNMLLVHNDLSS